MVFVGLVCLLSNRRITAVGLGNVGSCVVVGFTDVMLLVTIESFPPSFVFLCCNNSLLSCRNGWEM